MAIETPVESVEGEILKTDSTRPSVPPGHPRVANRDNLRRGVPIGTMDVEYYLYTDSSTQGWGAHLQELTASGIWSQDQSQLRINVLELQAWPKSFQPESGECEGCAHVRQHVSGCLPEKSGGHQITRYERFSHRHMSVVREEGNDTSSPLPSRSSECVSGPSVPEGSNPQDRVEPKPDRSRQDFSCLGQTFRGSVRPRVEHEIGNIRLTHSGRGVLESGQSCPELGRPVRVCVPSDKPERTCLNKVRTENVEIVLIAPG